VHPIAPGLCFGALPDPRDTSKKSPVRVLVHGNGRSLRREALLQRRTRHDGTRDRVAGVVLPAAVRH
jgi:hypothetical protein